MENILIALGGGIVALVLSFLFLKNYNRIDTYLFGKSVRSVLRDPRFTSGTNMAPDSEYEPFGRWQILVSALVGAICVMVPILDQVFYLELDVKSILLSAVLLLALIISFNFYEAIVRMPTANLRAGKFIFMTVSCCIGLGFGILGSLFVFAAVVLYIVIMAMRYALSGPSLKSGEVRLDNGTVLRNKKGLFGEDNYTDSDRNSWDRSGDTFTKR